MTDKIDTNVEHYTVSDLLTILDLENPNPFLISKKADYYIDKFTKEKNPTMIKFFQEIKESLLDYAEQLNDEYEEDPVTAELDYAREQSENWLKNEALQQKNSIQKDKITDRNQKISIFDNEHVPMNREQLGVSNTHNITIAQDILNPNLKNTTNRIIVLDSQYRQSTNTNETATDYTLDLSEPLLNVLSLKLYSYSIPYTWYNIDANYGNTSFWLTIPNPTPGESPVNLTIYLEPGNYNPTTIVQALTLSIQNAGIDVSGLTAPVYINPVNGKLKISLYNATYINHIPPLTIGSDTIMTFFDPTNQLNNENDNSNIIPCVSPVNMAINQTLGWVMGYRSAFEYVKDGGNQAFAIPDLYGPKYFILVIDDLNQNHINNGLIGITEMSKVVKLPSYYSPDIPYTCIPANPLLSNLQLESGTTSGTLLMDKLDITYSAIPQVLPSAPRILTQSQIYSINEILKNNEKTYNYKLKAPVVSDTFAILPIKLGSMKMGDVNVEFGGSLQDNKRIYFGPVNISRLRIKLLDDRGNVLNLNGCDWCVTLISENLYQY